MNGLPLSGVHAVSTTGHIHGQPASPGVYLPLRLIEHGCYYIHSSPAIDRAYQNHLRRIRSIYRGDTVSFRDHDPTSTTIHIRMVPDWGFSTFHSRMIVDGNRLLIHHDVLRVSLQ